MNRTKSSIKNIIYSFTGQFSDIIVSFIVRTVFVYYLGAEYLGVNGLFTNILSLLSLAELGIGSAITFSLYEPLVKNNIKKLNAILALFKRTYVGIGFFILSTGLVLLPFLNFFMKDNTPIPYIRLIYVLFLLNSSVSYLFSYKRALIIADQKKYIDSLYHYSGKIILGIGQIVIIILTKNFILYLVLKFIEIIVENILISKKIDKMYPLLNWNSDEKIEQSDMQLITKNVKALFFHRIGGVVVTGTDNLLIARFISLSAVGIYSNYNLIITSLDTMINIVFQSVTASVGNLGAIKEYTKTRANFEWIDFMGFWVISFSTVALLNLLNPFILIWLGDHYNFNHSIVLLIVIKFYVTGIRQSVLIFKDALGLFWYDRYKPIFESAINLVASIVLALQFGLAGIILGTIMSTLFTATWVEPLVLFKYGFKAKATNYFVTYFKRILTVILMCLTTITISNLVSNTSYLGFAYKMLITLIVPNVIILILFKEKSEFKQTINLFKTFLIEKVS